MKKQIASIIKVVALQINKTVLMSGAEYFSDEFAINALMDADSPIDPVSVATEHQSIQTAFQIAGVKIIKVGAPSDCQDGVYTANWGLCRGNLVVLSSLPNKRQAEEAYAENVLRNLDKKIIKPPFRFSGQGDALPCGDLLFCGSNYRTDPRMHQFLADNLGYQVISLQAVPKLDTAGQPVVNSITGWPDSFFYDLDLAIAILREDLIAWCPEAFTPESRAKIRQLDIEKIVVSFEEARYGFACNLVSTGETVVMSARAPKLKADLEAQGLKVLTPEIHELAKGGGYIRCVSLTLD